MSFIFYKISCLKSNNCIICATLLLIFHLCKLPLWFSQLCVKLRSFHIALCLEWWLSLFCLSEHQCLWHLWVASNGRVWCFTELGNEAVSPHTSVFSALTSTPSAPSTSQPDDVKSGEFCSIPLTSMSSSNDSLSSFF